MNLSLAVLLAGAMMSSGGEAFSTPLATTSRPVHTLSFPPMANKQTIINTKLYASTAIDVSSTLLLNNNHQHNKVPGWHRRVIRRVFRRGGGDNGGGRQQQSNTRAVAITHQYGYDDLAVLQQQERHRRFLSIFRGRNLPLELALPTSTNSGTTAIAKPATRSSSSTTSFYARWLERTVEHNLAGRFDRWTDGMHTNMHITSELRRPALHIVSGTLTCNVKLSADRLVFGAFRCSGGTLTATQLSLNLLSFTKLGQGKHRCQYRYPNAFDFHVEKLILTQRDLLESSCIRDGLRHLLTWILDRSLSRAFLANDNNKKGGSRTGTTVTGVSVDIRSIEILSVTGEVQVRGVVNTGALLAPPIAFAVKTRLGTSGRGHILTFPGLELFLLDNDMMRLPIPNITVDLGHNAQLYSIDTTAMSSTAGLSSSTLNGIDVQQRQPPPPAGGGGSLSISAKVRITPEHTRVDALSKYRQSSASFGSVCSVDVGAWLTQLGRFSL